MSENDASEQYELIERVLNSTRRSPGTTRTLFSSSEKMYLQKLVLKYRIHTKLNQPCKREAWARLTQDFNSIKSFNRTEAQLKKCWDNIKQRRLKKQGRSIEQSVDESQNTELEGAEFISDPLMPVKNEQPTWSDSQDNDSTTKEFEVAEETKTTDFNQQRNEDLHRLRVAEQVWTLKTVRERYATAQLEREKAQLERQRAHEDSEIAKLEVEKARFERDAAQYRSEKALLELQRAKRNDVEVINRKL